MGAIETAFAVLVMLLAGAAVILALVAAVCWLLVRVGRLRAQLRRPTAEDLFWQQHAALTLPERRER